nr:GIY-YIG nuclease family protein [Streptomyces sp. SID1046]
MRREVLIKIGVSNSPAKRAQSLNAIVLATMPGTHDDERSMHRRFKQHRAHNEWFRPGPDLISFINQLRQAKGQAPVTSAPDRNFLEAVLLDGSELGEHNP